MYKIGLYVIITVLSIKDLEWKLLGIINPAINDVKLDFPDPPI